MVNSGMVLKYCGINVSVMFKSCVTRSLRLEASFGLWEDHLLKPSTCPHATENRSPCRGGMRQYVLCFCLLASTVCLSARLSFLQTIGLRSLILPWWSFLMRAWQYPTGRGQISSHIWQSRWKGLFVIKFGTFWYTSTIESRIYNDVR